jgi:hypothetical protein
LPASSCNTFGRSDFILVPAPAASTITAEIVAEPVAVEDGRGSDDVLSTAHPFCEKALRLGAGSTHGAWRGVGSSRLRRART